MSNDMISVPRELLAEMLEALQPIYSLPPKFYGSTLGDRVRALLAQPNTCTKDVSQGGYCEPCHSFEPVAWQDPASPDRMCTAEHKAYALSKGGAPSSALSTLIEPLYRHPPAQAQQLSTHAPNCPNCPPPGATHTISGQFYRKAEGAWLVFGHKRDWVPSDAPAGWNDANLVPLFPVVLPEQLIQAIEKEQARLSAEDFLMDSGDCIAVIREELKRFTTTL